MFRASDLVACALPPGPEWLEVLRAAWDARAAVLPIDHRAPASERARVIEAARPTAVFDGSVFRLDGGEPVAEDVALVMATSGSTGEPKLVELTHTSLARAVSASLARLGAEPDDAWLLCLPVSHMGGMLVVLRSLLSGAPLEVTHDRARFTSMVPTQIVRAQDLSGFRAILVGGDALDPSRALPNTIQTYGMTESCGGVIYDGVALDGVEVSIDGEEIVLAGPTIMRGYRFGERAGDRLRTGDAGRIVDGKLEVLGRMDERITTGGEKVWPAVVERALRSHPAVTATVVRGEPDAEWGARVVAEVEARGVTEDELREHVRGLLARHEVPARIEVRARLARTVVDAPRRDRFRGS